MLRRLLPLMFILPALLASAQETARPPAAPPAGGQTQAVAAPAVVAAHDAGLSSLAQLLAGQTPENGDFSHWTSTEPWKSHKAFFRQNWSAAKRYRFAAAAAWRDREFKEAASSTGTLMYPFSGPDFLNADLFFPGASKYIFYSLEPTGQLPDPSSMKDEEFGQLLTEIQESLGDIFKRHYFITRKMNENLRTPYLKGNRTILLVFLALTGHRIVSLDDVSLTADGDPVPLADVQGTTRPVKGVKIVFTTDAGPEKTLYYYSLDVSDKGLRRHPEFLSFLAKNGSASTLLKSASYLLHDDQFSKIRRAILDTTGFMMEDDSGMPYRYFSPKEWNVTLYGKYSEPIADFNYGFQKDLAEAYGMNVSTGAAAALAAEAPPAPAPVKAPAAAIRPLPFKFGYHWWDGYSNVLTAVRKGNPAP